MLRHLLEKTARIAEAELFCESPEQIEKETEMTKEEIEEVLSKTDMTFYNECHRSFRGQIIRTRNESIRRRIKEQDKKIKGED